MIIKTCVVGFVSTNCYIIHQEDQTQCIVIDPGEVTFELHQYLQQSNLTIAAILLTHGHFDHITGVPALTADNTIPVYAYEAEQQLLGDAYMNASKPYRNPITLDQCRLVKDKELLSVAGLQIQVIHTPGHTVGSCCYYIKDEGVLFTGDTLFAGEVGRTDLPTGDYSMLLHSLREVLLHMSDDIIVYPGHDRSTTIGYEKSNNPYRA